jgi:hypothetical protein
MYLGKDNCPVCDALLDAASGMQNENDIPNPHDVSICIKCGEILEYGDDMGLIKITDIVYSELDTETKQMLKYYQNKI